MKKSQLILFRIFLITFFILISLLIFGAIVYGNNTFPEVPILFLCMKITMAAMILELLAIAFLSLIELIP